ncbi:MAG: ribosomal protein [Chloroflexi bacterium]|jgi:small subunit ribosomal protein S9|nr:ribosomal protein [Chloroflexota bacterium]
MAATLNKNYFYGTGRRKTAVARVRLMPGTGSFTVNGKTAQEYFGGRQLNQIIIEQALRLVNRLGQYNVTVKVVGGGVSGQAGAVRHGISRALIQADETLRPVLKKNGLLTRDARAKERKKPGLKRARKAPQYTKR